ncbi:MAG: hypothetical protein ACOC0U_02140 [Desulfovibrionales bacterium]
MDFELASARGTLLGQDFLTWLWCESEKRNGLFSGPSGESFFLYLEQRISVVGGEGESLEKTQVSGRMSELREARLGLQMGKKVDQVMIRIEQDSNEWQLQVKADDFNFNGLRTPKVQTKIEEGDDPDSPFFEKIFLLEKAVGFFDHVFSRFLLLRLGNDWEEECKKVRSWIVSEEGLA